MLFRPSQPARRLRSVALRYCVRQRAWQNDVVGEGRRLPLLGGGSVGSVPALGDDRERLARLEVVLFLAREPLSGRKLSQYADLTDGTEARTLVGRLNRRYEEGGRAFRVEQVAGGYQLLTRPPFSRWLRRLDHAPTDLRLSAPALETLAVVAYRQPVPRADIEAIRGVNCGEILRQLMERDLVRIGGRGGELGRPYLYATTKRFLAAFGLHSLDQLPRADVLRNAPIPTTTQPTDAAMDSSDECNLCPRDES